MSCAESALLCELFSSCSKQGATALVVTRGLLTAVASLEAHRLWGVWALVVPSRGLRTCHSPALGHRLNSCGSWASLLSGMRDLPRPGTEPLVSCLGRQIFFFFFFTTEPPGGLNYGFERSLYAELSLLLHQGFLASGIHTFHFQPFYLSLQAEMIVGFLAYVLAPCVVCSLGISSEDKLPSFKGQMLPCVCLLLATVQCFQTALYHLVSAEGL